MPVTKCLVLSDKQSETQTYSVAIVKDKKKQKFTFEKL